LLSKAQSGDTWYFICISLEAFVPWIEWIERALLDGTAVKMAMIDLEAVKNGGPVGDMYVDALCAWGFEDAKRSADNGLLDFERLRFRMRKRGKDPNLEIFRSIFPHSFLGFVAETCDESSDRRWGIISPYLIYVQNQQAHNFGVLFSDNRNTQGLYLKYLTSVKEYFRALSTLSANVMESPP
jgi:hypothetical protein